MKYVLDNYPAPKPQEVKNEPIMYIKLINSVMSIFWIHVI